MPPETTEPKRRTAVTVLGALAAVLAVAFLVAGGAMLWADAKKDGDGYLNTSTHRFHAGTAALATNNLDINLDGADWVVSYDHLGNIRLRVDPANGKRVFAGIAATRDVNAYLGRTAHTTVSDLNYPRFHATYTDQPGATRAMPPARERFWSASAHGAGRQTLTWKIRKGNWSVVVMNADGSPGVAADVRVGATLPFLTPLAWGTVGTGALLGGLAALLLVTADGPRRRAARRPAAVAPAAG